MPIYFYHRVVYESIPTLTLSRTQGLLTTLPTPTLAPTVLPPRS
jgi:hypothetical protein